EAELRVGVAPHLLLEPFGVVAPGTAGAVTAYPMLTDPGDQHPVGRSEADRFGGDRGPGPDHDAGRRPGRDLVLRPVLRVGEDQATVDDRERAALDVEEGESVLDLEHQSEAPTWPGYRRTRTVPGAERQ